MSRSLPAAFLAVGALILVHLGGFGLAARDRLPKPAPMVPYEVWVDFRVLVADPEKRMLLIQQVYNEPNDFPVDCRIRVAEDALIRLSKSKVVGRTRRSYAWRGSFHDIRAGLTGSLIRGLDREARYVTLYLGLVREPPVGTLRQSVE